MNTFRTFLAAYPAIGFGSGVGGGMLPFILAINPLLQFLGLFLGVVIAYLTIEAKMAERKERKAKKISDS